MSMMPRGAAASPFRNHDDDDDLVEIENIEKDFGPPPPKKSKVEEDNSSDPDRETFKRWCRYFRPDGRPEGYRNSEEKEKGFLNFKNWLHREGEEDKCPFLDPRCDNLYYLADLSPEEIKSHEDSALFSYCHISNELLDGFDEISSSHDDFFDRPVYA